MGCFVWMKFGRRRQSVARTDSDSNISKKNSNNNLTKQKSHYNSCCSSHQPSSLKSNFISQNSKISPTEPNSILHYSDFEDNYTLSKEILGTGVSGAVQVASHKITHERFAIKTLSLENVVAKKAAVLHNEVSIYLKLNHPNIAKLIEVYKTPEAIHLVMELCTGGELYQRLAARKKYSERDAANVTRQMLAAIDYCHKHHICHRDLKLENWVYANESPDSPLKLIDFGFSRIFNPGVPMTAMHGTVYYVSPEVMDGCYHEKCDIWSIGVIVYMLLSGSPPFNGSYDHEILVRIKRGAFNFSAARWDGISESAKSFIRYLLQKNPDFRPSASEALQHEWLRIDNTQVDHGIDLAVLKSMKSFALGNMLRRAAWTVMAQQISSKSSMQIDNIYPHLKSEKNRTILLSDLIKAIINNLHLSDVEAKLLHEKISQIGHHKISFDALISATQAPPTEELSKSRDDVSASHENIRLLLSDSYKGVSVETILAIFDTTEENEENNTALLKT